MDNGNFQTRKIEPDKEDQCKPSQEALEFPEMIKSRKEEVKVKTEEKRQEAVKMLEGRRLRNENERGSKEKLCGLPNEIWAKLLSHVDNPIDLGSMWEVHPKFSDLSGESQTIECLLSKLLSIDRLPFLWEDDWEKNDSLNTFGAISKGMRNAVDRYREEDFMKTLRNSSKYERMGRPNGWNMWLCNFSDINKELEKFREGPNEAEHGFSRSVALIASYNFQLRRENGRDRFLELKRNMISLLEIVGDQVWHFYFNPWMEQNCPSSSFCAAGTGVPMSEMYLFFREMVQLMPNLKWLNFTFACECDTKICMSAEALENHPFPHLNHLGRIEWGYLEDCQQDFEIAAAVIRPNSHIKTLDLRGYYDGTETEELKAILALLNLNEVVINRLQSWNHFEETLQPLQPLLDGGCKLRRFEFSMGTGISLASLFHFLNNFPTLEELSFSAESKTVRGELPTLMLPNLVSFQLWFNFSKRSAIKMDNSTKDSFLSLFSLNFLLHSKNLKDLYWSVRLNPKSEMKLFRSMISRERPEEMVNFKGGMQDLNYSNIWDVFPKLESVRIDITGEGKIKDGEFRRPKLFKID